MVMAVLLAYETRLEQVRIRLEDVSAGVGTLAAQLDILQIEGR
jgi:hypothetical protein